MAYLLLAKAQYEKRELAGSYNIGPDEADCVTTGELADMFCDIWQKRTGKSIHWVNQYDGGPHEANFLKLDCSKFKKCLGWHPMWSIDMALDKTIALYQTYYSNENVEECIDAQIKEYYMQ